MPTLKVAFNFYTLSLSRLNKNGHEFASGSPRPEVNQNNTEIALFSLCFALFYAASCRAAAHKTTNDTELRSENHLKKLSKKIIKKIYQKKLN